ncbi:unnamed protein product [Sphagnum jensenii]|uniref:Uncharacterized protein n=1 Tax=Sphagnum jensenii TaxID=128206 RepID=A0ABP1AJH4_9BRYO
MAMVAESYLQKHQFAQYRWQTSNSTYGRFYAKFDKEVMKQTTVVHKDCAKKSMELSTQLKLSKAQLDMMRLPGGHCRLCTNDHIETPRPVPSRVGLSDCLPEPEPPQNPDPLLSATTNGGMRYEIQTLEDHMKNAHPRLANREGWYFASQKEKSYNFTPHGTEAASYSSSPQTHEEYIPQSQRKHGGCGGRYPIGSKAMFPCRRSIVLPSQRYNFYKQFGFAGHGAKTSHGWHAK